MKRMALLSVALLLVQVINLCHLLTASCLQGPDFKSDPSKLTKVFFMALNQLLHRVSLHFRALCDQLRREGHLPQ